MKPWTGGSPPVLLSPEPQRKGYYACRYNFVGLCVVFGQKGQKDDGGLFPPTF